MIMATLRAAIIITNAIRLNAIRQKDACGYQEFCRKLKYSVQYATPCQIVRLS